LTKIDKKKYGISASWVTFKCFGSECTWFETEVDSCYPNTTAMFINSPSMFVYSTNKDISVSVSKMDVKIDSNGNYAVSLDTGDSTTAEIKIKMDCPKTGAMAIGCEVKALTGVMIDVDLTKQLFDLVTPQNLKDLKLSRCEEEKK
jgi:hypothetical protein